MKLRIFIAAVLLLTIVNTSISCSCATEDEGDGDFVELMKWVPRDSTSYIFWDFEELGNSDAYAIWLDWQDKEKAWLEAIGGIKTYEVRYFCQASVPDGGILTIMTGSFKPDEIEQNLIMADYEPAPYNSVSLLVKTVDDTETAVALYNGLIIGETELVKACIDLMKGEEGNPSLYDDVYIKEIADNLPGGLMTGIMRDRDEANTGENEYYENLIGLGISVQEKNKDTVTVNAVFRFANAGAAGRANTLKAIEDDLRDMDLAAIKCKCFEAEIHVKDEFIKAKSPMAMDNFSYFNLAS